MDAVIINLVIKRKRKVWWSNFRLNEVLPTTINRLCASYIEIINK